MQAIDPKRVAAWHLEGELWVPKSVDTVCPFCNHPSNLVTDSYSHHRANNTMGMLGRCVRCSQQSNLWAVGLKTRQQAPNWCKQIWMLPKPSAREIVVSAESLPTGIFNAYKEAVGCFNAGFWRATVTECNRALEGITQDKFEKEERKNLQLSPENRDLPQFKLFEPILKLAKVVRLLRQYSAHYHATKEPDREAAEEVLDLTEYLIKYFYVLPLKTDTLEAKINELDSLEQQEPEGS